MHVAVAARAEASVPRDPAPRDLGDSVLLEEDAVPSIAGHLAIADDGTAGVGEPESELSVLGDGGLVQIEKRAVLSCDAVEDAITDRRPRDVHANAIPCPDPRQVAADLAIDERELGDVEREDPVRPVARHLAPDEFGPGEVARVEAVRAVLDDPAVRETQDGAIGRPHAGPLVVP